MRRGCVGLTGVVALLVGMVICPQLAQAVIVNGGFESGNVTGWSAGGDVSVETSAFGIGPTEGTYQAKLTSGAFSVSASDLETFLGLAPGTLNGLSPSGQAAVEGSGITQTFSANAGDVLSFDWNFLTNEIADGSGINDFAFASIGSPFVLADTFTLAHSSSSIDFADETGFQTFFFPLPSSGLYTLKLGVVDVEDRSVDSGLLVDRIALSSPDPEPLIPEPTSLMLVGLGGLGAGLLQMRRRR